MHGLWPNACTESLFPSSCVVPGYHLLNDTISPWGEMKGVWKKDGKSSEPLFSEGQWSEYRPAMMPAVRLQLSHSILAAHPPDSPSAAPAPPPAAPQVTYQPLPPPLVAVD